MPERLPKRQHAVNLACNSRTPAGEAFNSLLIQVIQLARLFTAAGEALAKPAGQTLARWLVLAEVEDEPATVADIARALHLARQSVQRVADLLERDGLAAYEENPNHRRAKLLQLTPSGRAALGTIQTAQRAWADALGAQIGAANLQQARAGLGTVLRAFENSATSQTSAGERMMQPPRRRSPKPPSPLAGGDER
jgi:DNA-binding MarR family transcriptional regulator